MSYLLQPGDLILNIHSCCTFLVVRCFIAEEGHRILVLWDDGDLSETDAAPLTDTERLLSSREA